MTQLFTFRVCWLLPGMLLLLAADPCYALPQLDVEQEFQLAAGMYQREQWDAASAAFETIIRDFPNTHQAAVAHFFVGESLVQESNYDEAYTAYQKYLTMVPMHEFAGRATFRMGEAAYKVGNSSQALRLLETYLEDFPGSELTPFALSYLGEIRLQRNELQLAERVFEASLKAKPAGPIANQCRFGLARSLQKQGKTADAQRFYEFIIAEPGNPLTASAVVQLGIIRFANEKFDQAEELLKELLDSTHTSEVSTQTLGEAQYWLGRIAIQNQDPVAAIDYFSAIDTENLNSALSSAIWFDGAMTAWSNGDAKLATQWFVNLTKQLPRHDLADDAQRMLVLVYRDSQDDAATDAAVSEFIRSYPRSQYLAEVLEIKGRRAYERDDYAAAIKIFSRLLTSVEFKQQREDSNVTTTWAYFQSLAHMGLKEFRNAESLLASIDRDSATESLRPLVEIALATSRFAQNKYAAAIPNYRRYLEVSTDDRDQVVRRAQHELTLSLAHNQQWPAAVESFTSWAKHSRQANDTATVADTVRLLVALSAKHQQTQTTVALYRWMSGEDQPAEIASVGLAGLAWLQIDQQDTESAMATFTSLLARFPNSDHAAEAGMARARNFEDQQEWQEAADIYAGVARQFPESDSGWIALLRQGFALQKLSGPANLKLAKQVLKRWLGHAKTLTATDQASVVSLDEAVYQLGWVCHDLGEKAEGNEHFEDLFARYPGSKYWPDVTWRLASDYSKQKDYDRALEKLDRLVTRSGVPDNILVRGLFLRGSCLATTHEWSQAAATFESLLTQADNNVLQDKTIYWLAESQYQLERYPESQSQFQRLHVDPNRRIDPALRPWIALRLAQCYAKSENWSDASDVAIVARQRYPDFQLAHEYDYLIARGMEDAGQLPAAIERYQRVVDSDTGRESETAAMAQWRIGEVCFHQENYVAAIKAYYRVDSLFGYAQWRSAALLQAGKCQEHLQNWKHAQKLYTQLLELFPDSEFAADARQRLQQVKSIAGQSDRTAAKRIQRLETSR